MNRLTRLMLVLVFFMSASGLTPAGVLAAPPFQAPDPSDPGPGESAPAPAAPLADPVVYLPLALHRTTAFTVNGQVLDAQGRPIAGVTVASGAGAAAQTDAAGRYSLPVAPGPAFLAPAKDGYLFTPSMLEVNVNGPITGQNFTALADCAELIANGSFESTTWWNLGSTGYPGRYTTAGAHSGVRSMELGITSPYENQLADSRVRTPTITIPAGATSATVRMWLYPATTESLAAVLDKTSLLEIPEPVSAFGDATLLYDAQYVRVLDTNNSVIGTLFYVRSNNRYWSFHQFDLLPFAGRTIRLEIGAYNDGTDGITALYVDDVSLGVCTSGPTPPPPPPTGTCANQVANSGFEYNGSWNLPVTPYPAGYSYDAAYQGSRSMRTGIPLYTGSNVYSYSDAWQSVYIPAGLPNARLKMWLLPRSEEVGYSVAPEDTDAPLAPDALPSYAPEAGTVWDERTLAPEAPDAQYVLLLNNSGAILRYLEWWTPRNASGWIYREYDISAYAGQYVRVQVGTFNDGVGGRSVLYVDNLTVEVCAAPPPPPTCSERITNGGFENNSAWYTPVTAFSAGYSAWLRRSGARSMRTGIVYSYHNRYSYSDARQTVTIPGGVRSASLSFYAYSMSGEAYADAPLTEAPTVEQMAAASPTSGDLGAEAAAGDVQYLLVLDRYGNWIDTLVWQRSNAGRWQHYTFNLNRYIGQTIMLQWGTYNNGYSGVTSMYVDDVALQACP